MYVLMTVQPKNGQAKEPVLVDLTEVGSVLALLNSAFDGTSNLVIFHPVSVFESIDDLK